MTEREAAVLLYDGWIERTTEGPWAPGGAYRLLDPFTQMWNSASSEDAAALDTVLSTYPAVRSAWQATVDRREAHRGWCDSHNAPPCNCGYGAP